MGNQPNKKALYTFSDERCRCEGLALHVTVRKPQYDKPDIITLCFDDTNRGHMFDGKIIEQSDDGFVFRRDESGEVFTFKEVTLERFKDSVYKTVGNGENIAAVMADTADLWTWYRKEFPITPDW